MTLAELRAETEALTIGRERLRHQDRAGVGPLFGQEALFRAAPEIATWDSWSQVREATPDEDGRRKTRLTALAHHLVTLIASRDGWAREEAWVRASVVGVSGTSPGEEWPLRVAMDLLATEQNRESRAEAQRRCLDTIWNADAVLGRWQEGVRATFLRAGWSSTGAAWSARHDFDVALLAAEARTFLAETEGMYLDVMSWWLKRQTGLNPFPHEAERHDLLSALTLRPFQGLFPNRSDLLRVLAPFRKSGVELSAEGRLRLDLEARAAKPMSAGISPINAPHEVIAIVRPEGGFVAVRELLGAWGAGQHWANIEPGRPFEDRSLGDTAIPTAFGRLFQSVLLDRAWVRKAFGEEPPDLRRVIALHELFKLRHAAVVLLSSLDADSSGMGPGARELHGERASAALGVRWPAQLLRWECDVWLDGGTELLAAALEGGLFPRVQEQFDEDWWANPRATAYLHKLYGQGQVESSRVLAKTLGLGELSLGPIAKRLQSALG